MSTIETPNPTPPDVTKPPSKKETSKLLRQHRRQEASSSPSPDPLSSNYGDVPLIDLQSKPKTSLAWTHVSNLNEQLKGQEVLIRGRVHAIRVVGKKMSFLVVRKSGFSVQCVVNVAEDFVSLNMVKYVNGLSKESIVDVEGVVSVPHVAIKGATKQVEIQVRKLHCISRALSTLPINFEDAARSEVDIEKALQAGEPLVGVNQDTRLNHRVLEIRTPANQSIFQIQYQVKKIFEQFLELQGFVGIITPKIIAGSSEGGSAVFKLDYKGMPACLAQSPQLHKQMAICGDFERVFIVGPVFRAEDSNTHRHLCEFTSLDVEMEIEENYSELVCRNI